MRRVNPASGLERRERAIREVNEWTTPRAILRQVEAEFGPIRLDPCATAENAVAPRYYTRAEDGLRQSWQTDGAVFVNPPYGRDLPQWVRAAYEWSRCGQLVVALLPVRTDLAWWHTYVMRGEVRFIKGRLTFGGAESNAPFPSALVIFHPTRDASRAPAPRGARGWGEEAGR